MLHLLLRRSSLILALTLPAACGRLQLDRRSDKPGGDATEVDSVAPPETPAVPAPAKDEKPSIDGRRPSTEPATEQPVTFKRTTGLHYYQWDAKLRDLFSTAAVSQLCWPAALASEMAFLRDHRTPRVEALPLVPSPVDQTTDAIRYFANLCDTDAETGTTVIQGAHCIDKHVRSVGLIPKIHLAGVDARWGIFDLYPAGTTTASGPLTTARLQSDLEAGASVILMIGFYTKNARGWQRERGHFVATTGFAHRPSWKAQRLDLDIMNPAMAPLDHRLPFESVQLVRLADDFVAPVDIAYELLGDGFSDGSQRAFVETAVTFDVSSSPQ